MDERHEPDKLEPELEPELKEEEAGGRRASRAPKKATPVIFIVLAVLGVGCLGIALIAIVAAIAIPSLLRSKLEANHTAAAATLRVIASAQSNFRRMDSDGDGQPNYATHLRDLYYAKDTSGQPIQLIDRGLADADASAGGGIPRNGYLFADLATDASGNPYDRQNDFAVCAWPAAYNRTGLYTYVIDATGSVYCSDLAAGAPLTQYPETASWLLVR